MEAPAKLNEIDTNLQASKPELPDTRKEDATINKSVDNKIQNNNINVSKSIPQVPVLTKGFLGFDRRDNITKSQEFPRNNNPSRDNIAHKKEDFLKSNIPKSKSKTIIEIPKKGNLGTSKFQLNKDKEKKAEHKKETKS